MSALNANASTNSVVPASAAAPSSLYPLPKSPYPASTLYVVGVGGPSTPLGFTVAALQGIVARTQPQIFLTTNAGDKGWLQYLGQTYGIKSQTVSASQLVQQFKSYVTDSSGNIKIIVFDSNDALFPMQVNIATTLAGVYTAIPVSTNDLSTIKSIFGTKITILYDLTGKFTDKVSGYSWLWNLVGSQVTKQFIAMAPEGRVPLTDYIVEFKAFDFEICCASAGTHYTLTSSEQNFVNQVFSNYSPMAPVVGFFGLGGEVNTINYLSQHGFSATAGDGVADLSVYSGFPDATNLQQVPENSITYNPSKVYVLWQITQGDALQYDFYNNYAEWTAVDPSTNQPYRNEIPMTWQINPIMAELAPPILNGWYATQSALDDFITGPSGGAGYNHPDIMPNEAQQLAVATKLDANAGINIHFDIFQALSTSTYQNYISYTHPSAILLWQNSGRASQIVNGVPVMTSSFWEAAGVTFTSSDVTTATSQIQSSGKFAYVIMNAQNPGFPFVQQVMNKLGSNFVAVSAGQYTDLYLKSMGVSTSSSSTHSTTTQSTTTTHTTSTTSPTTTHSTSTSTTSPTTTHSTSTSTTSRSTSATSSTSSTHSTSTTQSTSATSSTSSTTKATSSTSKTTSSGSTSSTSPTTSTTNSTSSTTTSLMTSETSNSKSSSASTGSTSSDLTSTTITSSVDTQPNATTTTQTSKTTSPVNSSQTTFESTSVGSTTTTPSASSTQNTTAHSSLSSTTTSATSTQSVVTSVKSAAATSHTTTSNQSMTTTVAFRTVNGVSSGSILAPSPQQPLALILGAFAAFGVFFTAGPLIALLKPEERANKPSIGWRW